MSEQRTAVCRNCEYPFTMDDLEDGILSERGKWDHVRTNCPECEALQAVTFFKVPGFTYWPCSQDKEPCGLEQCQICEGEGGECI